MAEYIEREALQKRLEMHQATNPATIGKKQFQEGYYLGLSEAEIMIAQAPKADVAEVRHGRWIWDSDGYCRCSECTQKAPVMPQYQDEPITTMTKYCPHCGVRMDGGAENGE